MNSEKADIKTLKDLVSQTPEDSREMVDLLNTLSAKLRVSGADFDETSSIFQRARSIAQRVHYPEGEAMAVCLWGIQNISFQKRKEGIKILEESLEFASRINQKTLARLYCEYGYYLQLIGEFDKSFDYLGKALDIGINIDDKGIQSRVYYYLARLCYSLNELDDSYTYIQKALSFDDPQPSLNTLYDSQGYLHYLRGEHQKAIDCFNRALSARASYDVQSLINLKANLSLNLQKLGDVQEAERQIQSAVDLLKQIGNPMQKTLFLWDIADFYFEFGNYEKSMGYHEQISSIAMSDDDKNLYFLAEIHIGECLAKMGDIYQVDQHFMLTISKMESLSERDLPSINGLFYKCYSAMASFYKEINMADEEKKYNLKAEYYKQLMEAGELAQKTKKLTAKIKMEEFKMAPHS